MGQTPESVLLTKAELRVPVTLAGVFSMEGPCSDGNELLFSACCVLDKVPFVRINSFDFLNNPMKLVLLLS